MHWIIFVFVVWPGLIGLFYFNKFWVSFLKPLSNVPGLTVTEKIRFVYKYHRSERLKAYEDLFHSHGPLFKIWLGLKCLVNIGSAEYAEKILSCPVNVDKGFPYEFLRPWGGDSLPIAKSDIWHKKRKLLAPAFHFNVLHDNISVIVKNFKTITDLLEEKIDSEEFDILPYLTISSINTIGESAMNMNLIAERGTSNTYVEYAHRYILHAALRFFNPLLHYDFFHSFTENHRITMNIVEELHKVSRQIIRKNLSTRQEQRLSRQKETTTRDHEMDPERKRHKTFLDILLDKYEDGDTTLTLENIREEVDAFIFAGYDTVSVTIGFTIYLVGHHPEVQDKIHAELDTVLPTEDTPINAKTLAMMNYLECVMKESLRLYPPGPIISRCLQQPLVLDKYTLPAGADVLIHIHSIHRSSKYYSNPNKFDPSNFFPENANKRHPFAFIPFSAGPRNCIGQKFGKLETKVALALFFKKFKVESMTKIENLRLVSELVLQPKNGIIVKIKKRS